MTDRKKTELTPGRSFADSATGSASGGRRSSQNNRVTIESVRTTIGTRQASLLERKTLPAITKQVECELSITLSGQGCSQSKRSGVSAEGFLQGSMGRGP